MAKSKLSYEQCKLIESVYKCFLEHSVYNINSYYGMVTIFSYRTLKFKE